ncbi:MAG: cold shock domain-containing protein [Thermoplasmata archaeon]|jgi:CspA family cold shock protein|nr:cold shock domain-containing protein [Thermoplasmata archaeon]
MEGIVRKWVTSYGFISADGEDKDLFVHQSEVKGGNPLREGQKVKFEVKEEPRGPKAVNVEAIED